MKKVAVVIPTYSEELKPHELISLRHVCKVLKDYDIIFVAPEGLNCNYGDFCVGLKVMYFPKAFFKGTISYSQLLLSEGFYKSFHDYEYILIHQLDAFVFKDRLMEFCDMGYDYIGAPALRRVPLWQFMGARVGNGGLSLRKVESCARLVSQKEFFVSHPFKNDFLAFEDTFFGFAGTQPELHFRVPDINIARRFALQDEVQHALRGPVIELPFGVHAWQKINASLWGKVIHKLYGYPTQTMQGESKDYRRMFLDVHMKVRKVINANRLFGLLRQGKPKEALLYFIDWQEGAKIPDKDAGLVIAFLERLAQYSRMRALKGENKLAYELLGKALRDVAEEWNAHS